MNSVSKYWMKLVMCMVFIMNQDIAINNGYAEVTELKFSGTISVPEPSYWEYLKVGLITVSKGDKSINIKELKRETSGELKIIRNLYYYNAVNKEGASFPVQKGVIKGKNKLKRHFEVILPFPPVEGKSYYIVAYYDANKNDNWDVQNANNYFGDPGSEFIQLPVLASLNHDKLNRVDCVIGSFKKNKSIGYYFGFMSGNPDALASSFGVFNNDINDGLFTFTTNTYKK
ncbi:MAG: hypothetical protein EPN93_15745 [Spirochaetes bacterium]|nr:MAG: hypothetical protein EPN93_15745 [Spirochaetota bacterium]